MRPTRIRDVIMRKNLVTLFVAIAASVGMLCAEDTKVKIGELYYVLDYSSLKASVTSQNAVAPYWTENITSANIPEKVNYDEKEFTVTSIGEMAFSGCASLTTVTMKKGVKTIENMAFNDCSNLKSISLSSNLESIAFGAFKGCEKLTSITIPKSVKMIGGYAFINCTGLTNLQIANSTGSADLVIGEQAFSGCTALSNVELSTKLETISKQAFWGCTALKEIIFPAFLQTIGEEAFRDCTALAAITCKRATPPTCETDAFKNVNTSIPVYVPEGSLEAYKAAVEWEKFNNIEEGTAIEMIQDQTNLSNQSNKVIRNGQLFILRDGKTYSVTGQEVK